VCLLFFTLSTFLKAIKHELETIECFLDRDYHEDPFTSFLFWNEPTTDSFLEGIQTVTPFLEREDMRGDLSLTPSPTISEERREGEPMSDSFYSFLEEKERRIDPMSNSLSFLECEGDDPMTTSFLEDISIDHIPFPSSFLKEGGYDG